MRHCFLTSNIDFRPLYWFCRFLRKIILNVLGIVSSLRGLRHYICSFETDCSHFISAKRWRIWCLNCKIRFYIFLSQNASLGQILCPYNSFEHRWFRCCKLWLRRTSDKLLVTRSRFDNLFETSYLMSQKLNLGN